jgi:hypothetical protein
MEPVTFCVLLSGISFVGYAIAYFVGPKMKAEFERFGLQKYGLITILFEILGGLGLLTGYFLNIDILFKISALGLSVLMFLGVMVRLKVKDGLFVTLPAFFFFLLNAYLTWFAFFKI